MTKFNVIQKKRREKIQQEKRAVHGDANGKLKQRTQPLAISGKRKRKLLKKWKRGQKEAMGKGLVTMQDVEMAVADGSSQANKLKAQMKFNIKKSSKLRIKNLKGKSKTKSEKPPPTSASVDAMVD